MLTLRENVNLKPYNTFGIDALCSYFAEIHSTDDFLELIQQEVYKTQPKLILGGGSNLLFTKNFEGLVIKNNLQGIEPVSENNSEVLIKAAAGENWHGLVMYCIAHRYAGLENL